MTTGHTLENALQIIEISPDMRYAILTNERTTLQEMEKMRITLRNWQQSNEQFLILQNVTLQRVSE